MSFRNASQAVPAIWEGVSLISGGRFHPAPFPQKVISRLRVPKRTIGATDLDASELGATVQRTVASPDAIAGEDQMPLPGAGAGSGTYVRLPAFPWHASETKKTRKKSPRGEAIRACMRHDLRLNSSRGAWPSFLPAAGGCTYDFNAPPALPRQECKVAQYQTADTLRASGIVRQGPAMRTR